MEARHSRRFVINHLIRLLVGVLAVLVVVGVDAAPASAHTSGGPQPSSYRSQVDRLSPSVSGVGLEILDLGRQVRVRNTSGADVIILGYAGEPYLRVGPAGVFENRRSPSLYQNRILPLGGTPTVPAIADPNAPPDWRRRSGGTSVSWHDHRTHWTGPPPAAVRRRTSDAPVVVSEWTIHLREQQTDITALGTLTWEPDHSAAVPLGAALVLVLLAVGMSRTRWAGPALAVLLAVLVATDVVRNLLLATFPRDASLSEVARFADASYISVFAWGVGVYAIAKLEQAAGGRIAALIAGAAIGILSGLGDIPSLWRSELPLALPAFGRVSVVAALGLGLGITAACAPALWQPVVADDKDCAGDETSVDGRSEGSAD